MYVDILMRCLGHYRVTADTMNEVCRLCRRTRATAYIIGVIEAQRDTRNPATILRNEFKGIYCNMYY